MTDLEKIRLKNKIAETLGTWSSNNNVDLFVNGFEVRHPGSITYSDVTSYAFGRLEYATQKQIIAMIKKLDIAVPNGKKYGLRTPPPKSRSDRTPIKAFISHPTTDKRYANALRKIFKEYGIDAFVSGKDIKGGEVWEKRIRKEIDEMKFFIAIHTDAFSESLWCQQETGMAFMRDSEVKIIPINYNTEEAPKSFLTALQYIDKPGKTNKKIVKEILDILKTSSKTKDLYISRIEPKVKKLEKTAKAAKKNKVKPVSKIAEKPMNKLHEIVSDNSIEKIDVKAYTLTILELAKDTSIESELIVSVISKLGLFGNKLYHIPPLEGRNHLNKFTVSARDEILKNYPLDMEDRTKKIKEIYKKHDEDVAKRFGR